MVTEAEAEGCSHKPGEARGPQKPKEAGRPPLEPLQGAGPCQHLDFGLLASRIPRQQLPVA